MDAACQLGLTHPSLERACLDFSNITIDQICSTIDHDVFYSSIRTSLRSTAQDSKATMCMLLWNRLFHQILCMEPEEFVLFMEAKYDIAPYLGSDEECMVDLLALTLERRTPVALVMVSLEQVLTRAEPEDFRKLGIALIQTCAQNCKAMIAEGRDICSMKVFGIWAGGYQFRVAVAHPLISEDSSGRKEVSIVLSAPNCWGFDFLSYTAGPVCRDICCNSVGIKPIPERATSVAAALKQPPELAKISPFQPATGARSPGSSSIELEEVNFIAAAAFKYVCDDVIECLTELAELEQQPPGPPDQSMQEALWSCAAPTLSPTQHSPFHSWPHVPTAKPWRSFNPPISALRMGHSCTFRDGHDEERFRIRKPFRDGRELQILKQLLPNVLAPKLLDFIVAEDRESCVLEFERLSAADAQYAGRSAFVPTNDPDLHWHVLGAVTCSIHTLCGLYLLHNVHGVIHGDITKSSIMFSTAEDLWKIVGYGHAFSREEAVHSAANTGAITTASDVYALGEALSGLWYNELYDRIIEQGYGEVGVDELFEFFHSMIQKMTAKDGRQRPTVFEALSFFYEGYCRRVARYRDFSFLAEEQVFALVRQIYMQEFIEQDCAKGPAGSVAE